MLSSTSEGKVCVRDMSKWCRNFAKARIGSRSKLPEIGQTSVPLRPRHLRNQVRYWLLMAQRRPTYLQELIYSNRNVVDGKLNATGENLSLPNVGIWTKLRILQSQHSMKRRLSVRTILCKCILSSSSWWLLDECARSWYHFPGCSER